MADDRVVHLCRQLKLAEDAMVKLQCYLMEHCRDVQRGGGIVEWAINALEQARYERLEHEHLGCPVAKTGIYAFDGAREELREKMGGIPRLLLGFGGEDKGAVE